ncbi:MAG TPA: hypothetical protein PK843_09325 [bacterium]|nr:hypothetical protein [bacterium]
MVWSKVKPFVWEACKWGLLIWLLSPIAWMHEKPVPFPRIMIGIMLFVILSGKMFYDIMVNRRSREVEKSPAADLLATVAMVTVIALVVGLFVVTIGYLLLSGMQQATAPQE